MVRSKDKTNKQIFKSLFLAELGLCCCTRAFLWLQLASLVAGLWGMQASVVVAHGLSSRVRAQLPHGVWTLPRAGLEARSALAGRFFTTGSPGKSNKQIFIDIKKKLSYTNSDLKNCIKNKGSKNSKVITP